MSQKKPKERYLKIPYDIINIRELGLCEKNLLAHIYSFGAKGCYQSNATLAEFFMTSPRTIKRRLAHIVRANLVQIKSPKGYYRTIWARSHPDVQAATELYYRKKKIPKTDDQVGRKRPTRRDKNGTVSGPKPVSRQGHKCPTTNNKTIRETTADTTATPLPLPAGGQAPALLTDRKKQAVENIEKFKKSFGIGKPAHRPLSDKEFEDRRQKQQKALLAGS